MVTAALTPRGSFYLMNLGYELEKDNNGEWKDGYPDKNNHAIDAVRYALENDMKHKVFSFD